MDDKHRKKLLGLLFVGVLMGALDIAIIGPALPALREAFHIDERAAAWVLGIYVLFNLIGTPLMAKLSDRYGRRAVYIADVAIFAVGSLLVAVSPTFGWVLTGRAIQGLGSGGIFPVASAVIGDVFPPERRGRALGLIGAVFGIAFLVGPILGGVLLLLGWPWLFLVNLPIAAFVIWGARGLLPSKPAEVVRPFDWGGMATLAVALGGMAYALNRLDAQHLRTSVGSPGVWGFLVVAAVAAIAFVFLERRAADPVIRPRLFGARQVVLASGLAFGAGLSEATVIFVPALLVASFHVSQSNAAFMLLPIVLAMAIGAPTFGRLLDRAGSRVVVFIGTALIGLGTAGVGIFPATLVLFYAAGLLIGLGQAALLGSSLRYVMLAEAPPEERGSAQGILTVFTSTGQLIGSAAIGAVIASHASRIAGYGAAFIMIGVALGVLALASLGLKSRAAERAAMAATTPARA